MVSLGKLTVSSIGLGRSFNWIWLVELLVCGILVLFFLFYFNRLFATLVSYGLRAYTWHKFRVYIDIQALQISFLAGRVFFKGLRYHGENETIFVQNGYITWTYWLQSSRQVDLTRCDDITAASQKNKRADAEDISDGSSTGADDRESGSVKKADTSQSRIAVSVSGLEWFIYNRTPVYDAIINAPQSNATPQKGEGNGFVNGDRRNSQISEPYHNEEKNSNKLSSGDDSDRPAADPQRELFEFPDKGGKEAPGRSDTFSTLDPDKDHSSATSDSSTSILLKFLPIYVECHKGSISLGNENTRAILVTTFVRAKGHLDASGAGPLDYFRQLFEFDIEHPVIQMRPNPDFRQSQLAMAERLLSSPGFADNPKKWWSINLHIERRRRKAWHGLRNLVPRFRSSVESFHADTHNDKQDFREADWHGLGVERGEWIGLSRYLDDEERDDHEDWAHVDYARFSTIVDCPGIHMNFYWDVPGTVSNVEIDPSSPAGSRDINGADPPAYGLDLSVRGGTINYGPWADRLRAELQAAFLPNSYRSAETAVRLLPGAARQSTIMTIRVEVEEEVTLRVPTKESSKDWQWKGRANALRRTATPKKPRTKKHFRFKRSDKSNIGPDIRPFGWLSFSVAADSTVRYEMDLVARSEGYLNRLELDLKSTKAISGVNHAVLWRCGPQRLSCDLSNPLEWNKLHSWRFDIHSESMELFLLRDHMFLLIDLINDFTSGPKQEYMTFVPFYYHIGLVFSNFKLYLNANDSNIIDNPCESEDNVFLILGFQQLIGTVDIPLEKFAPSKNRVLFTGDGRDASMDFVTPLWNTFHTFTSTKPVATLKQLFLNGSYNYCADVSPQLTDSLILDIVGGSPKVFLHGFLIRYFMNVKENYFGENLHFKTLEEYQDSLAPGDGLDLQHGHAPNKKENDMDVILTVRADYSCALMPANIYSRKENIRFDILQVEGDMRFTNYYMDLDVKSSPVEVSLESVSSEGVGVTDSTSNCQLFIDGIDVYGHRLFGSPPTEPTYVCNWDFDVGKIVGECSTTFLKTFLLAIKSFVFTMDDDENALPVASPKIIHDITFLRAGVESVRLWIVTEETGLLLETGHIDVIFDDWAGPKFSKKVQAVVPDIILAAVDRNSAVRTREHTDQSVLTLACFQTSIDINTLDRKADFATQRRLQQHHIRYHDRRTRRADMFLHNSSIDTSNMRQADWADSAPAMPVPTMPPREREGDSSNKLSRPRRTKSKSSFLSSSSSSLPHHGSHQLSQPKLASYDKSGTENQILRNTNSLTHDPSVRSRHFNDLSSSNLTFATPWTSPHFPLQAVHPDMSEVPHVPRFQLRDFSGDGLETGNEYRGANAGRSSHAHMGVLCNLRTGFKGFCTPEFFVAIAVLLRDLMPTHPIDQLDSVQISTMSEIEKLSTHRKKIQEIVDFAVRLPFAHVRLINTTFIAQNKQQRDQYDVALAKMQLIGRTQAMNGDENLEQVGAGPVIHALASEISFILSEKSMDGSEDRASTRGSISDLSFWLSSQKITRAKLQVRRIELETWGKRVEYLASLIQRTEAMTEILAKNFSNLNDNDLLRHLVYHLTIEDNTTADPIFLTRPSYVLRSAGSHLRLNDSWKLISRLRHIYNSLPSSSQKQILQQCREGTGETPEDAENRIRFSFENWKTWDHDGVDCSTVLSKIFGATAVSSQPQPPSQNLEFNVSIGRTGVILDPGPNQSAFTLGDLSAGISATTVDPDLDYESPDPKRLIPRVNVYSYVSQIALNLNWELVELVGNTLEQFKLFDRHKPSSKDNRAEKQLNPTPEFSLSVILGTDNASITVDSINLRLMLASEKMRCSLLHRSLSHSPTNSNLVIASTSAAAKLKSKGKTLLGWRLFSPSICASQISDPRLVDTPNDLRLAASCGRLRFDLKEDILGILNVAHQVIKDEATFVRTLMARIERVSVSNEKPPPENMQVKTEIHIAMFLDDYRLRLALLPSFKYAISGEVARTSIVPRMKGKLEIDFDLKRHSHSFRSGNVPKGQPTTALEMPPINGRVLVRSKKNITNIRVQTTVEQISFEAAAVRACIDALNRPDIARTVVDAKASFGRAQSELNKIFSSPLAPVVVPKAKDPTTTIQYKGQLTLAGLNIHASAPPLQNQKYNAELDFLLGFTTLCVHNKTETEDLVHELPQVDLHIWQVALGVRRRSSYENTNFGKVGLNLRLKGATELDDQGNKVQVYRASSNGLNVDLYAETVSLVMDVAAFLQERLKSFTLNEEARNFKPLRRLTLATLDERPELKVEAETVDDDDASGSLFDSIYSLDLHAIQARWMLYDHALISPSRELEDLVFSIRKVDLKTKREGSARLAITDLQLQMVPKTRDPIERSSNSALLPEVVFNAAHFSTKKDRRFAFQVAGKALDLRLAPDFIVPASVLQKSLASASSDLRDANKSWTTSPTSARKGSSSLLGKKRLASLLVDADFAGAVVNVKARKEEQRTSVFGILKGEQRSRAGRYGQVVQGETAQEATLRAPGIALKVEYRDNGTDDPTLGTELKVAASSNVLYPSVVPLILDISSSVKEMMGNSETPQETETGASQSIRYLSDETLNSGDPVAILGRCKLNAGLWIQKQEFSLSCQPIARVSATAKFDDIFITINTVQANDQDRFFALLTTFNNLQASVQHVYSRESTASFEVKTIMISLMNSKHISNKTGISAILNISPMKTDINAKQLQDFLLFREIWYPSELRQSSAPSPPTTTTDAHVQRYQQVATGAFPWNAVVSIEELKIQLDLGQGLGKSLFKISKLWASSKKSSDLEQNLCIGFERVGVDCSGRMSGFIELQDFHLRTAIRWPHGVENTTRAPLVQGSVGFSHLRVKASFDYQMFAVADVSSFEFLMYNVREDGQLEQDRLVGILNGDKVQVFCTTGSAGQGLALYQAFERLVQEKKEDYQTSLRELDRYLRRQSLFPSGPWTAATNEPEEETDDLPKAPSSLHTDVVVTLKEVNIGAFPTTFFDTQIFKADAIDAQARFAVAIRNNETQCGLGMKLGQLRVALATVNRSNTQALGEVSVTDIIQRATSAKGGTILRVPRLVMSMQTFQEFESKLIRYTFKSLFEGKVDVGWNYSRISFIRGMWSAHARALAQRLGKPLPQPAVKITAEPSSDGSDQRQEKITAVVQMPQSKFDYIAIEPPIIDTPQLRDLGEATPSLEWAGLHRDRLPNVTHQIVIVTLLEVAREVEDAYTRILGSV